MVSLHSNRKVTKTPGYRKNSHFDLSLTTAYGKEAEGQFSEKRLEVGAPAFLQSHSLDFTR